MLHYIKLKCKLISAMQCETFQVQNTVNVPEIHVQNTLIVPQIQVQNTVNVLKMFRMVKLNDRRQIVKCHR